MEEQLNNTLKTRIKNFKNQIKKPRKFTVEVNLTEACNFNCEYCFEANKKISGKPHVLNQNPQVLFDAIQYILDSSWFNYHFTKLSIVFWGGEPTLNLELMKLIINEFENDKRVTFMIYTNGSRIPFLIDIIQNVRDRFEIQISYDGNPIHDMRRVRKGQPTSRVVKSGMETLYLNGIDFTLKSTIMPKDFIHMDEAWDDIYKLWQRYGDKIKYSPTIDYYNNVFSEEHLKNLEMAMLVIASKEYHFYKKENRCLLTWFNKKNKAICSSGKSMCAIDIDGNVYFCHGAIYSGPMSEFRYTNIFDKEEMLNAIQLTQEKLEVEIYDDECERCVATTCLRCNHAKCLNSDKTNLVDRFYDMKCQPDLCTYYKLIGKINRALMAKIKEEI